MAISALLMIALLATMLVCHAYSLGRSPIPTGSIVSANTYTLAPSYANSPGIRPWTKNHSFDIFEKRCLLTVQRRREKNAKFFVGDKLYKYSIHLYISEPLDQDILSWQGTSHMNAEEAIAKLEELHLSTSDLLASGVLTKRELQAFINSTKLLSSISSAVAQLCAYLFLFILLSQSACAIRLLFLCFLRHRRIANNRCFECGHPIIDIITHCTECGTLLIRRTAR